jgi:hypothetical protein
LRSDGSSALGLFRSRCEEKRRELDNRVTARSIAFDRGEALVKIMALPGE